MVINNIYKGKKDLFVLEVASDLVKFTVLELNIKTRQYKRSTYPSKLHQDYLEAKNLKLVSYGELEAELTKAYNNVKNKFDGLVNKFLKCTDEVTHPEYRHFVYEWKNNVCPLLTEGVVKAIHCAKRIIDMHDIWNDFYDELSAYADSLNPDLFLKMPDEVDIIRDTVRTDDYVLAVVKSGKYVFDDTILDSGCSDDEEDTVSEPSIDSDTISVGRSLA